MYEYFDGPSYLGEWINGHRSNGIYQHSNGSMYQGAWSDTDTLKHGQGCQLDPAED